MSWDDEKAQTAVAMRRKGRSATVIACQLGMTRNAVIGKLARLGVTADSNMQRRGGLMAAAMAAEKVSAKASKSVVPNSSFVREVNRARAGNSFESPAVPMPRRNQDAAAFDAARLAEAVPLGELAAGACVFAVTPDDVPAHGHLFCAAPVADRSAGLFDPRRRYCRHHVERVIARSGKAGV